MDRTLRIRPLGRMARLADALMIPLMYLVAGSLREAPQQTHFWNNEKFHPEDMSFDEKKMMYCCGCKKARRRRILFIPIFHMPLFGGWRKYIVLEPAHHDDVWHAGWMSPDVCGVSRIPLSGPVRVLVGPEDVSFFGVTPEGKQLAIKKIGSGSIGKGGPYTQIPLL